MNEEGVRQVEIGLLLEGLQQVHGYDFRQYNEASLRRRLEQWLSSSPYPSFGAALSVVLRDAAACETLVRGITVNVTEMFRDPGFFQALRQEVVPYLQTWPHAKLWVAGCASGEEVYSLAIVLHEEGLIGRCRIYATDINQEVLEVAQKGIYPLKNMQQY
ncbi:MAG TPA: CheR family methyltransferase, partial [Pseudomonas sp.]|nr:CheR family methyltransferase [Pseudomonas sp.]